MEAANSLQARGSTEQHARPSAQDGASCPMCHGSGSPSQNWLAQRRGWIVIGLVAVAALALAFGQGWVTFAALAPVLYLLPCAAMMFFCMRGMKHGTQTTQGQTATPVPPAPAVEVRNEAATPGRP